VVKGAKSFHEKFYTPNQTQPYTGAALMVPKKGHQGPGKDDVDVTPPCGNIRKVDNLILPPAHTPN